MSLKNPLKITNVIVVGKSGAGKQPRIDVLVSEFNLEQLSTGDIFRSYLKNFNDFGYVDDLKKFWDDDNKIFISNENIVEKIGTTDNDIILGLKAKFFVDQGLFVPDYITKALFESEFKKKCYTNQILDGYPRTLDQSKFLLKLINEKKSKIDFILKVENTDKRIIQRTVNRRICSKCGKVYHLEYKPPPKNGICKCGGNIIQRSDDTEEKIKSRLKEFKDKALNAINYLTDHDIPLVNVPGHLEEFTHENVRNSVMVNVSRLFEKVSKK